MSPYDSTEGFSGTDTSRERAERRQRDGSASATVRLIRDHLHRFGPHGATSWEIEDAYSKGHGEISGALTNMHKRGEVARTKRRRGPKGRRTQKVYVLPESILPDDILEPYVPSVSKAQMQVDVLEDRITRARMAMLTESNTAALKILEES